MQLFCTITAKSGQRVPLLLENTDLTPTQLRQKVSEVTKIPLKDLRLIFRGRMIKDDDSIQSVASEYKLENDSVLHCMGKPVEDSSSAGSAPVASTVPDTTTVPSRTTVPPLSTTTTPASAPAATASPSAASTNGDPLSKALLRLKQNNPLSVFVTAVGTLEKILTNIVNNAMEEKYRRVKKNNAAFGKRLGKLVGGHDCMLATGFVVEHQSGEEVYQLHASAEKWNALMQAKAAVAAASTQAKQEQERAQQQPMTAFGNSGAAPTNPMGGMGMGGMGGFAPPNMNDPNTQNMMAQMMSNPEALGQALQNPMVQQMMQNDPNVSPMLRQYMETMANNPAMLQQMAQRMQDPAVRAQLQRAMQQGGIPGMGGMPGMGSMPGTGNAPASSSRPAPPPPPQNDQGQTEEEMIAEAIRRSLEDN
eukprot:CAMPEP_0116127908 /NCGR_PEP_ID=MMETSP0329-20121206/7082_1 /TAXON_ID=697910 /ORGANISM="Pseudo-nitzschia arenysensis, Strain B593" /LENGTH=419 /DNA_ID=CAMNT_0003622021 /DNA_START=124 /DNA_END=1383 /DNA_ORIENTATION=+